MTDCDKIRSTLTAMKIDALQIKETNDQILLRHTMEKWSTVFTGDKFNKVLSIEVANYLKMDNTVFNSLVGQVTHELQMGLEGLHQIDSSDPNSTDAYYINLY